MLELARYLREHPGENAAIVAHSTSVNCLDNQLGSSTQGGSGERANGCGDPLAGLPVARLKEGEAWIADASTNPAIVIDHVSVDSWSKRRRDVQKAVENYCTGRPNVAPQPDPCNQLRKTAVEVLQVVVTLIVLSME